MREIQKWAFNLLMASFLLMGCTLHQEIIPTHDEILLFDLPYDLTYLRTFEAVDQAEDWDVETTDKKLGIVQARNVDYGDIFNSDKRIIKILLKRTDNGVTSVQLSPESQQVIGGGKLLEEVSKYLSNEL